MKNPWEDISKPSSNLAFRRIDAGHKMNFFWGKNIKNNYLFAVQMNDKIIIDEQKLPKLSGIEFIDFKEESKQYLILILINNNDWEIFLSLCENILYHTSFISDEKQNYNILVLRLNRWAEILKINKERVSEDFIKGLIGELYFLKNYLFEKYNIRNALSFWTGPDGSPQDFCVCDTAYEVKTQIGTTKPYIKISSIDQLNTQLSCMYLFVLTMGKSDDTYKNKVSLPGIINEIEEIIIEKDFSQLNLFKSLLFEYGYLYKSMYDEYSYVISNEIFFEVKDDFPKLNIDLVKEGIDFIKYSIDLNFCHEFKVDNKEMREIL